jgi:hypothetical protein
MTIAPDVMGFIYLAEQTSPDQNVVKNFDVVDKNGVFYVDFETCLHSFDVMNRNSRMYRGSNIEKCLQTERIQHYLSHGGWFGEQNHPISKYADVKLSSDRIQDIDMDNTSHKMLNPHVEKNLLVSRIQTDSGTQAGMNLAKKMVQGFIPGFSCRAIASMVLEAGKPIVDVRKIITYDWVLFQSHREAEQITDVPNKFVNKSVDCVAEATVTHDDGYTTVIPLKEILEDTGVHDVNAQIIMESFGLDLDSVCGLSKSKKHLIMRDRDNMIYCNITPESRAKVNEYLRSF